MNAEEEESHVLLFVHIDTQLSEGNFMAIHMRCLYYTSPCNRPGAFQALAMTDMDGTKLKLGRLER